MSHAATEDAVQAGGTAEKPVAPKKKVVLSEGKRAERKLGWLLCAPAALTMIAVTGWPILYSVLLSMQRFDLKFPELAGLGEHGSLPPAPVSPAPAVADKPDDD